MNLQNQLKYYLKAYGITASELSRRSKVPKQSISDWLNGVIPRSFPHVKSVAETFGLTIDELCYGDAGQGVPQERLAVKSGEDITSVDNSNQIWMSGFFEGHIRKITLDDIAKSKSVVAAGTTDGKTSDGESSAGKASDGSVNNSGF